MTPRLIPLASDTETRPTPAMRQAIASAQVGDEQRGLDPTVLALQERVADLLGQEAALWMPGGTMCNLVSIKVWTRPGDALVSESMAHILRAESAGLALASGVQSEPIETARGTFGPEELAAALERLRAVPPPYGPPPRLVCLEQTHNLRGGTVWSVEEIQAVVREARSRGLRVHMDGARLMNAAIAADTPAASFCRGLDSVWLDFTKGLGAPIGAVLAGSRDFIAEARRFKHLFGGAMRQAGIAAAGCLHALDHHVERLAVDHENARLLASGLAEIPGIDVRTPAPETNIVFFDVAGLGLDTSTFLARLREEGVEMSGVCGMPRAVTHLDVDRSQIETAISSIRGIAGV